MSENFDKSDNDKKESLASRGRQMVDNLNQNEIQSWEDSKDAILKTFEDEMYQYLEAEMVKAIDQQRNSFRFILHCGMHLVAERSPRWSWPDESGWRGKKRACANISADEILHRVQALIQQQFPLANIEPMKEGQLNGLTDLEPWAGNVRSPIYSIGPIARMQMYLRNEPREDREVRPESGWPPMYVSQHFGFQTRDQRGRLGGQWRGWIREDWQERRMPLLWIQDEPIVHTEFVYESWPESWDDEYHETMGQIWQEKSARYMPEIRIDDGSFSLLFREYGDSLSQKWRIAEEEFFDDGMGMPRAESYSGLYLLDVRDSDGNLIETVPERSASGMRFVTIIW